MSDLYKSFAAGYGCLSAWADLLDRINVFPVADGDTGTNLRISLAPLRACERDDRRTLELLTRSATGNSGNIAAAFFKEFFQARSYSDLAARAALGQKQAWQAIGSPRGGTMLTVFDSLAFTLASQVLLQSIYSPLTIALQNAVHDTSLLLPELKNAGVVDSGALAMYIFFEGFFRHLSQQNEQPPSILELFGGKLVINSSFRPAINDDYCVDVVIERNSVDGANKGSLEGLGDSVVMIEDESILKIHLHTPDPKQLRGRLSSFGSILHWSAREIDQGTAERGLEPTAASLHIVTDGAGSITREMARHHGITLLDSYIITGDDSRPESLCLPEQLYPLLRMGKKITTAQASTFERHQHYQNICQQFGHSLYLPAGAAFTGNYAAAVAWKKEHDSGNLFTVLDSGAASGRLALIALLTARLAKTVDAREDIIAFAHHLINDCEEFVFIDELKYLAAGGRISRAGGFFGDLLSMKPVVSPTITGVKKRGVVRSRAGQLAFAMGRLKERFNRADAPVIMLQYSDNEQWVADTVGGQVRALLPEAEILFVPLSLTSGVHMGPGTWSIAYYSGEKENF
jgi:uncharacterized protein